MGREPRVEQPHGSEALNGGRWIDDGRTRGARRGTRGCPFHCELVWCVRCAVARSPDGRGRAPTMGAAFYVCPMLVPHRANLVHAH